MPAGQSHFLSCIAQYHWAIKPAMEESLYRAGRLDLFMAACLPYCDRFITTDPGQYNALRLVAEKAHLATRVRMYSEFRREWLI